MLAAYWAIPVGVLAVLIAVWITFTLTRLDRLHARCDAAAAALDAQLVRRAAALLHVAESPAWQLDPDLRARVERVSHQALSSVAEEGRAAAENAVGRMLVEIATQASLSEAAGTGGIRPDGLAELHEASERVQVARRFYNDAVRDTRSLRGRRMPRLLRLAGRRRIPEYFDIDDDIAFEIALPRRRPTQVPATAPTVPPGSAATPSSATPPTATPPPATPTAVRQD